VTEELCGLIERAAIVQDGEKCTRWMAELIAARTRGYPTWHEAVTAAKAGDAE
jgi:hypothetical protein